MRRDANTVVVDAYDVLTDRIALRWRADDGEWSAWGAQTRIGAPPMAQRIDVEARDDAGNVISEIALKNS